MCPNTGYVRRPGQRLWLPLRQELPQFGQLVEAATRPRAPTISSGKHGFLLLSEESCHGDAGRSTGPFRLMGLGCDFLGRAGMVRGSLVATQAGRRLSSLAGGLSGSTTG